MISKHDKLSWQVIMISHGNYSGVTPIRGFPFIRVDMQVSHVTVSGGWGRREKVSHVTVSGGWRAKVMVSHVTVAGSWREQGKRCHM